MTDQDPKTLEQVDGPKPEGEAPNLDQLLAEADPTFAAEMSEVQSVGAETDVIIEADAIDAIDDGKEEGKKESFIKKIQYQIKIKSILFGRRMVRMAVGSALWLFEKLKIWIPAAAKATLSFIKSNIKAFTQLNGAQKLALIASLIMGVVMFALLKMNMKGQWIPLFDQPELRRFSEIADKELDVGPDKEFIPLYTAFSLPNYEFLLPKFKSNLKPTAEHTLPMAAMELIITLDSRDTAVEMKDREAAVFDRVQRVIEGVTYEQLVSPLGKEHLKSLIKKDLNTLLTQGWVEDISYKTLVLKP